MDEYDKPILDALATPAVARANRDALRGLYSAIKFSDAHIRFTLLTGVSKFSKVSLFSGLNNLTDVSLDPGYAAVCGYTDADLDTVFAAELPGLDRQALRDWYNGYDWLGAERVYNPFDILLFLRSRKFKAHWFETGTPTFLIDMPMKRGVASPDLDGMIGTDALLSAFDVDETSTEALLFQTGYLTIRAEEERNGKTYYRLGYPNREVRQSLNERILNALLPETSRRLAEDGLLRDLLEAHDFAGLENLFRTIFASIPHQWHVNNDIADYRGTTPACSTPASPGRGSTSSRRKAAAAAVRTWHCASMAPSICSSSRRWKRCRREKRWRNSRPRATPTNTVTAANRSSWSGWSSAARTAPSPPSMSNASPLPERPRPDAMPRSGTRKRVANVATNG